MKPASGHTTCYFPRVCRRQGQTITLLSELRDTRAYATSACPVSLSLSSQASTGGAADCTATLYYISGLRTVTVGTLSFTAGA
jgi:hypothetical protein